MIEVPYRKLGEVATLWPEDQDPRVLARVESDHWAAILAQTQSERSFSRHTHGDHRVTLIVSGVEHINVNGSSRRDSAGALSIIAADTPHHSVIESHGMTFLSLAIDGNAPLRKRAELFPATRQLGTAWRIYRELAMGTQRCPLVVEGLCTEIELALTERGRPDRFEPAWLSRVFEMIMDDPAADHSIASLADKVGVHRCHLARVFVQKYHCTLQELIVSRRLHRSLTLLGDPGRSLSRVAIECGFYDQSHYCRHFKSIFGQTPKQARRLLGTDAELPE